MKVSVRRNWGGSLIAGLIAVWAALGSPCLGAVPRPNVLWLTCEDTGPHLGCYGDAYASTPHLDALAARGLRFRRAWSVAPVCAPARTAIITGLYPSSTGSEHMRSDVPLPRGARMFPEYLRDAGYYCSNNQKEDYNLQKAGDVWDDSSNKAHWRQRDPDQPFFAVFNFTETHESATRRRPHAWVHDPARAPVPPYMPDSKEVREGWAQYYDQISVVDRRVAGVLAALEADGLTESTIVFFFGDHGAGLPRHKRSACDSGLRVPFLVYFPPAWRHLAPPDYQEGGESKRLISFVDLAPTMLSLAGIRPPHGMQGRAFAGEFVARPPEFLHGLRGRMDERIDLVRCVTDGRYVYVRNFHPHKPHGQHVEYLFETPMTVDWFARFRRGELPPEQRAYWEPKAAEELYDLESDPFEIHNLAASARTVDRNALQRLRQAQHRQALAQRDIGLLPESEMHRRSVTVPPGDLAGVVRRVSIRAVLDAAELASNRDLDGEGALRRWLRHEEPGVRYWAATGFAVREGPLSAAVANEITVCLDDVSPAVRVAAAEALVRRGNAASIRDGRATLLKEADPRVGGYWAAVEAMNVIDATKERLGDLSPLRDLPRRVEGISPRCNDYLERLSRSILADAKP
ncbi:MAG: sulfatase-like hydrolase/transferase [Verrucomicrobiales bacterium]|nr:sulfatase-like hydrolase/transferase [Verrucomicrobiales bacterium]